VKRATCRYNIVYRTSHIMWYSFIIFGLYSVFNASNTADWSTTGKLART